MPGKRTPMGPAPVAFGKGSDMSLDDFRAQEAIIERGKTTFLEVGQALLTIREAKAYKLDGYKTFEDYCERRWHFSRQAGYLYISAARAAENVNTGLHSPVGHRVARELARLPESEQREVAQLTEGKPAAEVRQAVERRRPNYEQPTTIATREVTKHTPVKDYSKYKGHKPERELQEKPCPDCGYLRCCCEVEGPLDGSVPQVEDVQAPPVSSPLDVMARAATRHNAAAVRSTWSRALGDIRTLVKMTDAGEVAAALSRQEQDETREAYEALGRWMLVFEQAAAVA